VGPATYDGWDEALNLNAELVVGNQDLLSSWLAAPTKPLLHLKFDTGMGRQGFSPAEAPSLLDTLSDSNSLHKIAGVCTHFANVEDVTDQSYALTQMARFKTAQEVFKQTGLPIHYHCAASASTLILDISHMDLVRVGISLYGLWPSSLTRVSFLQQHQQLLDLTPVLSWYTQITTLKHIPKGQFIGYGCSYRAVRDMKVAVLPVGYFEGYPRIAGESSSFVLIEGQRCPVVGRICMNMMMVDVTHVDNINVGTLATLIGRDGSETITAGDLAGWAKTIHYEVITRLHPEIPRKIL
jgi:alanine racemase